MRLCLLLLLTLWSSSSGSDALSCKGEKNQKVDWYILYKEPGDLKYSYISTDGEITVNKEIGASDGILANTLSPMFQKTMPKSLGFLSYSDQPPDGKTVSAIYGHSKGVVLGDSETKTALWITHSTPKFPFSRDLKSFWPKSGKRNAQTFMCVTLSFDQLKDIGTHLQKIRAHTFDGRIPPGFPKEIRDAANKKGPDPHFLNLKVGNMQFQVVAKGVGESTEDGDLYVQLSHQFKSDIDAKVWCQQNNDVSYCKGQYKVMNVIGVQTGLGAWGWTTDHSKWAVTTNNNVHWTCIGDMNRAESQYERPGGALCIRDEGVSKIFKGFVKETLACGKRPRSCYNNDDMEVLSDNLEEMNLNKHEDL